MGLGGPRYGLLVSLSFLLLAFVFGLLLHSCRMAAAAPAITAVSKAEWKRGRQAEGRSHPVPMPLSSLRGESLPASISRHPPSCPLARTGPDYPCPWQRGIELAQTDFIFQGLLCCFLDRVRVLGQGRKAGGVAVPVPGMLFNSQFTDGEN